MQDQNESFDYYASFDLALLGHRIRRARESNNMTQQQLADKLGKTADAISNYEKGQRAIRITELPTLAQALDIPIEVLFLKETAHEDRVIETFRSIHVLPAEWLSFLLHTMEKMVNTYHMIENDDIPGETEKAEVVLSDDFLAYVFSIEIIPMLPAFEWPDLDAERLDVRQSKQVAERLSHLETSVSHQFIAFQQWIKRARTEVTK